MAASVILQEQFSVPLDLRALSDFRRWALSEEFPDTGRIDFIRGDIEVDMSPEDLFSHGTLKGKIYASILMRVEQLELGHLFTDRTRISNVHADLSVEPDILLIRHDSIEQKRVRLIPKATGDLDRFIEVEGSPDLVVEIVSDSSVRKDTQKLLKAYHDAGVPEYWIIDARGDELIFQIHYDSKMQYDRQPVDDDGFQSSSVLGCRYRLTRERGKGGYWRYSLEVG